MKTLIGPLAMCLMLAGCASSSSLSEPAGTDAFTLWSPQFPDGAALERRHAGDLSSNPNCVGSNVSPALSWRNVPTGTKSFAMLVHDQEGRNGLGVVHWVAYNIPVGITSLSEGEISSPSTKYTGGKSTLGLATYMGPCPPARTGHHHYVFTVIATDLETDQLPAGLSMGELLGRLNGRAKAGSSIVLRYGRP